MSTPRSTSAPRSTSVALKDYLLSRDDQLAFRSCARLNTALDNALPRASGQTATLSQSKHAITFESLLNTHRQILVCKDEVIAVVASRPRLHAKHNSDAVARIKDPRIVVAVIPDPADHREEGAGVNQMGGEEEGAGVNRLGGEEEGPGVNQLGGEEEGATAAVRSKRSKKQVKRKGNAEKSQGFAAELETESDRSEREGPPHQVTLAHIDVTDTDPPPQDVVRGVLSHLSQAISAGEPFTWHVRTYLQYLRAVHSATTIEGHKRCVNLLRDYVFLMSYPKMLSRFESGVVRGREKHPFNFWPILTGLAEALPEHARNGALPIHLAGRKPNAAQADRITKLFRGSNCPDDVAAMDVYTTHVDRLRFHRMLLSFLKRAKQGLFNLRAAMSGMTSRSGEDVNAAGVISALSQARKGVNMLLNFLDEFDEFLLPHLEWLAEAAGVVELNEEPTWTVRTTQTPIHQSGVLPAPPQTGNFPHAEEIGEDADEDADMLKRAQFPDDSGASSHTSKTWASACKVFVRLPCLHEESLRRATGAHPHFKTGSQSYESALIQQAEVTVINFEINQRDDKTAIINESFIEKLRRHQPELDPKKLIDHLRTLNIIKDGNLIHQQDPTATGTPHCETMLMSLIAIAKNAEIMSHISDEQLRVNGIFATKKDLLRFPDDMIMVTGSKSACQSCDKTRKEMSLAIKKPYKFTALHSREANLSDAHGAWSAAQLPSFMPLTLGKYVVESTKMETAAKLLQFQISADANIAKRIQEDESSKLEELKGLSEWKYGENHEDDETYDWFDEPLPEVSL